MEVYRWSDGSYLEDLDFWRLSGIERSVYCVSTPPEHIRDFLPSPIWTGMLKGIDGWRCDLENHLTKALRPRHRSHGAARRGRSARCAHSRWRRASKCGEAVEAEVDSDRAAVASEAKWSAETPNLYTLVISILDESRAVKRWSEPVGFRKVEIRDGSCRSTASVFQRRESP